MENAAGVIILSVIGGATLVALLTVWLYLIPGFAHRVQLQMESRPGRSFGVGVVNLTFFGILAALLAQAEVLQLITILILLALLALTVTGLSGFLLLLRGRLYPHTVETLGETLKTAVLLVAAGLAPVVGWFVLTPITLLTGLGATITVLLRRKQTNKAVPNDVTYNP